MHVFEITVIPSTQSLRQDANNPAGALDVDFERLLLQLRLLLQNPASALEIILASESNGRLGLYMAVRGDAQGVCAATLRQQLEANNYSIQVLEPRPQAELTGKLAMAMAADMHAVIKTEKLVTSELSYVGYYYFADILRPNRESKRNHFSALLHTLQRCPDSFVSFQLIPTVLQQNEAYALNELSSSLEQVVHGMYMYGQMIREPYAEAPQRTYAYYTQRIGQPLFLYNIIAASASNCAHILSAQILSDIQTAANGPVDLDVVNIRERRQLAQDYESFPWRLNQALQQRYRNPVIWNGDMMPPMNFMRLPFLVTVEEAACFFRLPIDDGSIAGFYSNKLAQNRDVLASSVVSEDNILLGVVKGREGVSIGAPLKSFTQHALIVGMPGTGKTTFSINLLLQFCRRGIPFLAIEPTKTEYRAMLDAIPELQVFTPGNNAVSPFVINPFIPPAGIALEQYIPSLASAFKAAFSMPQPLDMIFLSAIRKCYTEHGWKNHSKAGDVDVRPFGLYEFILTFKRLVASTEYSREVRSNIQSGGTLRLMNLIEQNSNIYDTIHSVPLEDMLRKPTVLELNAIDNTEYKSLLMALLLINICVYTKHNQAGDGQLKNIILIDEAHVLLGGRGHADAERVDSQGSTVKALQDMIAEIRSYGTGIIIADQAPSKVGKEVVANTDIKVAFRLVGGEEKSMIADATGMDENATQYLSRLGTGEAFVHYRLLESPQLIVTQDIRAKEGIRLQIPNEEIVQRMDYWSGHKRLLMPFSECAISQSCRNGCDFMVRSQAEYYANRIADAFAERIDDKAKLIKYVLKMHELVIYYERNAADHTKIKRLCNCVKIRFLRNVLLNRTISLTREERQKLLANALIKESDNHV